MSDRKKQIEEMTEKHVQGWDNNILPIEYCAHRGDLLWAHRESFGVGLSVGLEMATKAERERCAKFLLEDEFITYVPPPGLTKKEYGQSLLLEAAARILNPKKGLTE